jgi:hypothetical protein
MTSDAVRFWALGLQTALDNFGAVIREWLFEDEISKHGGEKCPAFSIDQMFDQMIQIKQIKSDQIW